MPTKTATSKSQTSSAQPAQPAYGQQWLDQSAADEIEEDLTCPSGALCRVRRVGPEAFMEPAILAQMDWLTGLVQTEHIDRVSGKKTAKESDDNIDDFFSEIVKDPQKFQDMVKLVNTVATIVVVKPNIQLPPEDPTERVPGQVYTDMIDLADKFYIMNWAQGGARGLATFRDGSSANVGSVDARAAMEAAAKRAVRRK